MITPSSVDPSRHLPSFIRCRFRDVSATSSANMLAHGENAAFENFRTQATFDRVQMELELR
jgi:hypothetical protein